MTGGLRRSVLGSLLALAGAAAVGALGGYGWSRWGRARRGQGPVPEPQPPRRPWSPTGERRAGVLWDWTGIVGTGQSLSVGTSGVPVLSRGPVLQNLKLSLGGAEPYDAEDERLRLVPLYEPIRELTKEYPGAYPRNIWGETPHSAMAHQVSMLARAELGRDCVTVHSVVGESGQGITVIGRAAKPERSAGHAWAAGLFEARAIARLAREQGKTYGVAAIVLTHGETDFDRKGYAAELRELWEDYNADLSGITGQTQTIVLLLTQQCAVPEEPGTTSASTLAAWRAASDGSGNIVCVGPRYQYRYAADHLHLTALSYARLGEKYGQVFFQHVLQGRAFRPLSPLALQRRGGDVVVRFHVPVPPLRWDEALPQVDAGRGFELLAGGVPVPIAKATLEGGDTVVLSPSRELSGPVVLRYALTARAARPGGTVRWGQLCDSDPFVGSHTRTAQPNYAVAFELELP